MSELEPIPLGVPFEHTVSERAVASLTNYILTHNFYFRDNAIAFQRAYNARNRITATPYQGIRLLTHATENARQYAKEPLPVPPEFLNIGEETWQYVADDYQPRDYTSAA